MGSTPATSRALYAGEDGKLVVRHVPFPEPQEGELLIKVLYSGVNPADTKIIDFFGLKNFVIGTEFCGEVLESKALASTSFKAGDIVAGVLFGGQNPPLRWGTHQEFMTIAVSWAWKVPENLPPQDAAGLSIVGNVVTATKARVPSQLTVHRVDSCHRPFQRHRPSPTTECCQGYAR